MKIAASLTSLAILLAGATPSFSAEGGSSFVLTMVLLVAVTTVIAALLVFISIVFASAFWDRVQRRNLKKVRVPVASRGYRPSGSRRLGRA